MFKKLKAYFAEREEFWSSLRVLSDAEFEARYCRRGLPWELDAFFPYFVRARQARIDREMAESVAKLDEKVKELEAEVRKAARHNAHVRDIAKASNVKYEELKRSLEA